MVRRAYWIYTILAISLICAAFGCAETARLRGGILTMREKIKQVERNGAYSCAPKELALAKAHLDYAELEIQQGRGSRARYHYDVAQRNAELADEKSPADLCAGPAVVVEDCVDADMDRICEPPVGEDRCPDKPEDFDGFEDGDGCPEEQDSDSDGIEDALDQCMLDPEDKDNYLDDDGCPDEDNDLDKVLDTVDNCPNEPEDPDGYKDDDGCPDPDNDRDDILDINDECPNQFGEKETNGCPKKYEGVEITETHIRINQTIHFAYNKDIIKPVSFPILYTVAQVLKDHPKITISVEGHTDSRGGDEYNKDLSQRRAGAVMTFLTAKGGVSASRLTYKGWGEERPVDSNQTDEGRAANRRVEFVRTDVSEQP